MTRGFCTRSNDEYLQVEFLAIGIADNVWLGRCDRWRTSADERDDLWP
jgi:hypothetical protein